MTAEEELARLHTVYVRGVTNSKVGTAILTNDRILFFDEKFSSNAAYGILEDVIIRKLQKRHEEGGPLLDLPLASITGLARRKKLMAKNRLVVSTDEDEYIFNEGWDKWSDLLRETLVARHGRRVIEEQPDVCRVEPA